MPSIVSGERRSVSSVVELIGNTPLVRLRSFEAGLPDVELYAKLEGKNPGGSVKDRPAARMIAEGVRSGALRPGKTILDATSGNTGIAYAMIAAAERIPVRLCIPDNVTPERKRILRAYGADLVFTNPLEGSDGAIRRAREIYAADPDRFFYPDQYNNAANWMAHFETTGPEIIEQTGGRITHFVTGLGTSGTFMGVGRRLRQFSPAVRLVSMQPAEALHGLEGLKHMESAIVPGIYDPGLADDDIRTGTEDAYEMVRQLARREGLLVGISSGANLAAALAVAAGAPNAVVVTIFCDGGEKYLSEHFWDAAAEGGR
ncbi:MAG: pyridoxal-phosphate dependent enzyme [Acidimicrobiia bacterium]|nr:pyridoxal-phosphate dependent enzyme [Acidimicrobiia bacterium]